MCKGQKLKLAHDRTGSPVVSRMFCISLVDSAHQGYSEFNSALVSRNLLGEGSVDLDIDGESRIATVTLKRPEKRNAFSGGMMIELGHATDQLASWKDGVGVILTGAGDHFCSGGDLGLVKEIANSKDGLMMSTYMHSVLTQFSRLPMVTVALVRGMAVGGGAELATACDFRLLHPDARVGFVQSKMGVATGWGGGTRLVQLLGRRKALRLMVSGALLRADEALRLEFADQLLRDEEEGPRTDLDQAKNFIQSLVSDKDTDVIRTSKMISCIASEQDQEQALEIERTLFASIWGGKAHAKAMAQNMKHNE